MQRICAETRIAAPAQTVYDIVADLPNYGKWNPWNICCEGETGDAVREGAVFRVSVLLNDRIMTVRHKVIEMLPGRRFTWCDLGWFTFFAYGERSRIVGDAGGGQTDFRIELRITGPFSGLAGRMYGKSIRAGMAAEIAALKQHAESLAARAAQGAA